jgi:hypothetical protein
MASTPIGAPHMGQLSPREGVEDFISNAYSAGAPLRCVFILDA